MKIRTVQLDTDALFATFGPHRVPLSGEGDSSYEISSHEFHSVVVGEQLDIEATEVTELEEEATA